MSHLLARRELVNSPLITVSLSPRCVSTPPTRVRRPPGTGSILANWLSGAGLLILEATAVEPAGVSPGDLGLWDDETENALRGVVEDIRAGRRSVWGSSWVMPDARHPAPPRGREAISWRSTMVAGRPSPLPPWRFTMAIAPR